MKGRRACGDEQAPPAESSSVTHGSASHAPPRPGLGGGWGPGRPADSWAAAVTAGTMRVSTERTAGPQVALPGEKGPAR